MPTCKLESEKKKKKKKNQTCDISTADKKSLISTYRTNPFFSSQNTVSGCSDKKIELGYRSESISSEVKIIYTLITRKQPKRDR